MTKPLPTKKPFDLADWERALGHALRGAKSLGTRSKDPLVRWSEVGQGPLHVCADCHAAFTPLGLPRHRKTCGAAK